MIGDWVINPVHNDCSKIESVYYDKELHCLVGTDGRFPQQCFNPIPLTAEILELNGFENIEEVSFYQEDGIIGDGIWQNDQLLCGIDNTKGEFLFYTFSVDPNDDGLINKIEKVIYVHELQHALRLCGLRDLADNFKVE